jgi:hypothetical protein
VLLRQLKIKIVYWKQIYGYHGCENFKLGFKDCEVKSVAEQDTDSNVGV